MELILHPSKDIEELLKELKKSSKKPATIQFSPVMKATLTGKKEVFRIVSRHPEHSEGQAVSLIDPTKWIWQITALEAGVQELYLTVNVVIIINKHEVLYNIKTFHEKIQVDVSSVEEVKFFWQTTGIF